ncbi:autophagy-specific 4 [Thecamonas trahens ATCC 50062]|uniref:Cysteine protease n=1 Tax=Thecamonas trahens ATCC 50062 TaxID=461836 RepID=A0A0L0D6Y7_THETB|nr:autophagy-specific 4 [Thecamonas trahens ATCC 50062]KNC47975.1 autophagy-specific 4 [Thecamonas trahens ATCC 50062]|eukprot:XP_013758992.1 autophagy-specific 4 [Thecamonas trahens ATCC 50062]
MMKLVSAVVAKSNKAAALYNKMTAAKGVALDPDSPYVLLGRRYPPPAEPQPHSPPLLRVICSTPWVTYRRGFAPIEPSPQSSDVGWGCMLRVGQMALAQALVRLLLGDDWVIPPETFAARLTAARVLDDAELEAIAASAGPASLAALPDAYYDILSWFADVPSPATPYAIHHFAWLGCRLGLNIGEWFAPTTIGNCMRYLVNAHAPGNLAMVVAYDATVYLRRLVASCTAPVGESDPLDATMWLVAPGSSRASDGVPDLPHVDPAGVSSDTAGIVRATSTTPPISPAVSCEALDQAAAAGPSSLYPEMPTLSPGLDYVARSSGSAAGLPTTADNWRPLLLLVPVRLGLEQLSEVYHEPLKAVFEFPQTVGVLGGKPKGALFFVGVQGDNLIYLDPHSVQPVAHVEHGNPQSAFSYQCLTPRSMPLSKIDPSMALCFLCRDLNSLHDLLARLDALNATAGVSMFSVVPGDAPGYPPAACSSAPPPSQSLSGGNTSWEDDDFEFL